MKKLIKYALSFTLLVSILNCKPKTSEQNSVTIQNNLKRVWMLVEFQNFKKEDLVKNKAQMDLTDLKNSNANMGCNGMGFEVVAKEKNIQFSIVMRTEMFCEGKMELENAFSQSLPEFDSYMIEGQKLILENKKDEKMIFIAQD